MIVQGRRSFCGWAVATTASLYAPQLLAQAAEDSGRLIPAPDRNPYPYRGVSGPGAATMPDDARGGWMSGLAGVRYRGARSMA